MKESVKGFGFALGLALLMAVGGGVGSVQAQERNRHAEMVRDPCDQTKRGERSFSMAGANHTAVYQLNVSSSLVCNSKELATADRSYVIVMINSFVVLERLRMVEERVAASDYSVDYDTVMAAWTDADDDEASRRLSRRLEAVTVPGETMMAALSRLVQAGS